MKRIIVRCPCGDTVIWTKDYDDGMSDFSTQEGIGEEQDCCDKKVMSEAKQHDVFAHAMKDVKPIKKRGRGR